MLIDLRLDPWVVNSLNLERLHDLLQPCAVEDVVIRLVSDTLILEELLDISPVLSLLCRLIHIVHAQVEGELVRSLLIDVVFN